MFRATLTAIGVSGASGAIAADLPAQP